MSRSNRRVWRVGRRVTAAALLLAAVCAAVLFARTRVSAEGLVRSALSRALGLPVELAAARITLGPPLHVEILGLSVYESADPGARPLFTAHSATASHSWALLLAGDLLPRQWTLEAPHLRLRRESLGGPPLPARLPPLQIEAHRGEVELVGEGDAPPLRLRALEMQGGPQGLLGELVATATGALVRGERELATFAAEIAQSEGVLRVAGSVAGLDVAGLSGVAGAAGRAGGGFSLEYRDGRLAGAFGLGASGLRLPHPALSAPLEPTEAELSAEVEWSAEGLRLRPDPLRLDDVVVRGEAFLGSGPAGRLRASLNLGSFQPGRPDRRLTPLRLLGLRFAPWHAVDARFEAGVVERTSLEVDLPREGLAESLGFRRKLAPHELRLSFRLRDAVYRPRPGTDPLRRMSGALTIEGNVLRVEDLRMELRGRPLPRIHVEVDGMHRLCHLPPEERASPSGVGPLPGLAPTARAVGRGTGEGEPLVVDFEDLDLAYPALLFPLRDARGRLRLPRNELRVEEGRGVYGGAPAEIEAIWSQASSSVHVKVRYLDEAAPPRRDRGPGWLHAHVFLPRLPLGSWLLEETGSWVSARGPEVRFEAVSGRLASGRLAGAGELSLAQPDGGTYAFDLAHEDGNAGMITHFMGMAVGRVEGTAGAKGRLAGRFVPGRRFLDDAKIGFDVQLTGGRVADLPVAIALARLPSLQGLSGLFGSSLPYDLVTGHFEIDGGVLSVQRFELAGPQLRARAEGTVELVPPEKPTHMSVGVLFLATVDRVLVHVPFVKQVVLGKDQSLLGLYVQLDGPWSAPTVRPVAPEMLQTAAGWTGSLIQGGVRQLWKLFRRAPPAEEGESENGAGTGPDR